jgi:hypothetical protein
MANDLNQIHAFPTRIGDDWHGLSRLEYFAAAALVAVKKDQSFQDIANDAFCIAVEMLQLSEEFGHGK